MPLDKEHRGGTTVVVDRDSRSEVKGPFSSDDIADRWIAEHGPRYDAHQRRLEAEREQEEGKEDGAQ